ncbi:MAG TPA: DUF1573 domain-containing protein [Bacteroidia bacterium]|jgi:hypothetical protein|nr:DUF1573 domain-containing protein [Bacteroidia bacterium]
MKRLFIVFTCLITVLAAYSCHPKDNTNGNSSNTDKLSSSVINVPASAANNPSGKLPKMVFADTNHDFGDITEGDKVACVFKFKNTGEGDLVISNAVASCGCTKPYYPQETKHPGDTGTISVTFDSSDKMGKVVKTVTVTSNCQPQFKFLTITANIKPSNK